MLFAPNEIALFAPKVIIIERGFETQSFISAPALWRVLMANRRTSMHCHLKAAVIRAAFSVDTESELHRSYRELACHYSCKIDPRPPLCAALLERYPKHRAEAASRRAVFYGSLSYRSLKNILTQALDLEPLPQMILSKGGFSRPRLARDINDLVVTYVEVSHESN